MSVELADGAINHILQSTCIFGYVQMMVRRPIRNDENESLDPKALESFKVFLGPIAARYSELQLIQLRADMRAAARLLLDLYLLKKKDRDKARQDFDSLSRDP